MGAEEAKVQVVVALLEGTRPREAAERLERRGLASPVALDQLNVVTGWIEPSRLAELEATEGVDSVERARRVSLPPPAADTQ